MDSNNINLLEHQIKLLVQQEISNLFNCFNNANNDPLFINDSFYYSIRRVFEDMLRDEIINIFRNLYGELREVIKNNILLEMTNELQTGVSRIIIEDIIKDEFNMLLEDEEIRNKFIKKITERVTRNQLLDFEE